MKKKYNISAVFALFVLMLQMPVTAASQGMDPEIQQMTQDLIRWTQEQFEKYGSVDQAKLDSMNNLIRLKQQEIEARNKKSPATADSNAHSEATTRIMDMIQGSALKVPEGKTWKVKNVTCKSGIGDYAILVTSVKFRDSYTAGETITMPAFTSEASLLTDDTSSVIYTFTILEYSAKQ